MRIGITATQAKLIDDGATLQQAITPAGSLQPITTNGNGSTPVHYATDQNINVNPPIVTAPAIPDDVLALEQPGTTTPADQSNINQMIVPNNCDGCNGDTITQPIPATDQPTPAGSLSFDFGSVEDWIKQNTWTAILIGGAIVYLLTKKK